MCAISLLLMFNQVSYINHFPSLFSFPHWKNQERWGRNHEKWKESRDKYWSIIITVWLYMKFVELTMYVSSLLFTPYLYLQKPLNRLSANRASICLEPQNLCTSTTHALQKNKKSSQSMSMTQWSNK